MKVVMNKQTQTREKEKQQIFKEDDDKPYYGTYKWDHKLKKWIKADKPIIKGNE